MSAVLTFLVSSYAMFTLFILVVRFERGLLLLIPIVPLAVYTYHTPITAQPEQPAGYTAFHGSPAPHGAPRGSCHPPLPPSSSSMTLILADRLPQSPPVVIRTLRPGAGS
jgi:hypothetical protein